MAVFESEARRGAAGEEEPLVAIKMSKSLPPGGRLIESPVVRQSARPVRRRLQLAGLPPVAPKGLQWLSFTTDSSDRTLKIGLSRLFCS